MAISSTRCPVVGATVVLVTDFEGHVTRVICPQYEDPSGACRLKLDASGGGPLSQLLERASEDTLRSRSTQCDLAV